MFVNPRSSQQERMDDPSGDKNLLFTTLKQFEITNRLFSRNRFLAKSLLLPHMRRRQQGRYILFDLGAGGCDFALWLIPYARDRGIELEVHCFDNNPRVIEYAKKRCAGVEGISIVLDSALNLSRYIRPDYIFANHLLHHLSETELAALLKLAHKQATLGVLFNDLRRSKWTYAFFWIFSFFMLRKSYARADGLISIRKGFSISDLKRYAGPIVGSEFEFHVEPVFPGRIVVYGFR